MDPDIVLLDAESPRCPQIKAKSGIQLMSHQLAMILKCMQIEMSGSELTPLHVCKPRQGPGIPAVGTQKAEANHGVMMDPPGAGKTFVAVCLAIQDMRIDPKRTTVIFAPSHVVNQWGQTVAIVAGAQTPLKQMSMGYPVSKSAPAWVQLSGYSDLMLLFTNPQMIQNYNIIIAPYIFYEQLVPALSQVSVHRIMFDEIESNLPFVKTKVQQAPNIWFISATIEKALENGKLVLGPYTQPVTSFKGNVCKCEPTFIADSIRIPNPVMHTIVCHDMLVEECLLPFVGTFHPDIALNINAGDIQRASTLLSTRHAPAGTTISGPAAKPMDERDSMLHSLSRCLSDENRPKFNAALSRIGKCFTCSPGPCTCEPCPNEKFNEEEDHAEPVIELACPSGDESSSDNGDAHQEHEHENIVTPKRKEKRRIHTALSYFQNAYASAYADDITLTNTMDATESDCEESASQSIQTDQTCKQIMTIASTDAQESFDDTPKNEMVIEPVEQMPSVTKLEMLETTILSIVQERRQQQATPRILLVSECPGAFSGLCMVLDRHGIKHKPLENSSLETTLVAYHDGNIQVLLYDAAIFGTGLNLQMTTDIVFMHAPSSAYVYEQAIGRAQRPGRSTPLHAWFLLHPNELAC